MSEQENRNDALDRLFQQKAKEYDISYNEDDWSKLENRLDDLDQQRTARTRRWFIAAAIVLAFSILAYFTVENQLQINKLNTQLSNNHPAEQPTKNVPEENEKEQPSQKGVTGDEADQSLTLNQQDVKSNTESEEDHVRPNATQQFTAYSLTKKTADIPSAYSGLNHPDNTISTLKSLKTQPGSAVPTTGSDEPPLILTNMGRETFTRASLGLVMGPDLSTAGSLSNFYNPGYKLGFTLNYNFSPNFGIETGIIRTRTRYTAGRNDYRPPQGYWSNGIKPQKTIGDCILLDIPVSLKYNFLHLNRSRFYTTAGISSYIMLDEKYRFRYNNYQPGIANEWSAKTGTKHWFSNASFSVGYEFDLLQNWSLQVEPFLRVPLKEVGWGKVDLYSMGTLVSLNFNLKGN